MRKTLLVLSLMLLAFTGAYAEGVEGLYVEDFDGSHYDGTSYLPVGWDSEGSQRFMTLSWYTLPAHSGRYYAISIDTRSYQTSTQRDDWMYSCYFNLEAGVKYSGSYWIHNDMASTDVNFTVGKEQNAAAHTVLHTTSEATPLGEWVEKTFEFTPSESGAYCFGWNVTSGDMLSTFVAIDDFSIIQAWMLDLPKADFCINHIYDITTGDLVTYPGQQIKVDNLSDKAETYSWTADNDNVVFSDATAAEPTISFVKDGPCTIKLESKNSTGTTSKELYIWPSMANDLEYFGVSTFDGGINDQLIQRGSVPTFKTDLDYDFVTGPNHLYREFAERYAFAEGCPMKLHCMNVFLTEYNLRTDMWATQQNVPIEVIVYGETADGKPDPNNIYGTLSTTIGSIFGTTGVGGTSAEPRNIVFDEPIIVNGPVYISIRVSEDFSINDDGKKVIRSYFCLAPIARRKTSTMMVKPYYLPSGIATPTLQLGDWCTAAQLDADMPKALGMYNIVWASPVISDGIQEINADGSADSSKDRIENGMRNSLFNLQGQRIENVDGYHGIGIRNGKKVVIR